MEFSNKQLVVIALIAGIVLGLGVGGIGGFFFGVQQVSAFTEASMDELCEEYFKAPAASTGNIEILDEGGCSAP